VSVLREHRKEQLEARLAAGHHFNEEDLVFCGVDGKPLNPESVSKSFDRRVLACNLPRIRFHDLRHTWASPALEAGVNPKVVSDRLGHATVAFTLDTYSHVASSVAEDAPKMVADLVFGPS
jgi:integrase